MEGVRQRGMRLLEMGHQVEVVSLDAPQAPYLSCYGLPVHALGARPGVYRYSPSLLPWLLAHVPSYDAVVVNGLWQYHSLATWRACRKLGRDYHVFTHGMLDPWFKQTYPLKHAKKWLYWPWAEYRVLRDAATVLFTSEEERLMARRSFWLYRAREKVVSYGTQQPPQDAAALRAQFFAEHPQLAHRRLVLFLGRIHPKKGCDLLIKALPAALAQEPRLHLVMAGPDAVGWQAELQQLAASLGVAEHISWPGMLNGARKWGAFYASDVFALPSHQENFGISVAEALACRLPVLLSDKVNIWREVQADGAGLVGPDTAAGTQATLLQWLQMAPAANEAFRQRAHDSFSARYSIDAMARSLLDVVDTTANASAGNSAGVHLLSAQLPQSQPAAKLHP